MQAIPSESEEIAVPRQMPKKVIPPKKAVKKDVETSTDTTTATNTTISSAPTTVKEEPVKTESTGSTASAGKIAAKKTQTIVHQNFKRYIRALLKNINEDIGLQDDTASTLNRIVEILITKIMNSVNETLLALLPNRKTLTSKEIIAAIELSFPVEIATPTIKFVTSTIENYDKTNTDSLKLVFSVPRIRHMIAARTLANRKSAIANIALTAAIEHIITIILTQSASFTDNASLKRITPRHVLLGIKNENGLNGLFADTIFSGGVAA
jgi:histone H3/H4